jgi:DNA polymerase-3 subunit gamma/tau
LAERFDPEDLQLDYQIAIHGRQDLPFAPDAYAGFTMALLRMIAFRAAAPSASSQTAGQPEVKPAARPRPVDAAPPRPVSQGVSKSASSVPQHRAEARPSGVPRAAAAASRADTRADTRPSEAEQAAAGTAITDWPELVKRLNVGGLARQLAQQSAMVSFDDGLLALRIAPNCRHLTEKAYQDKLRAALEEHIGGPVRLRIDVGDTGGGSAQDRAVAAIGQDDFVRGMVEQFDATIVESSVKPTQ